MNQHDVLVAGVAATLVASAGSAQVIRLSHSVDESCVEAGASIACATGSPTQTTGDNQWSRSFRLADFGIAATDRVQVRRITFGIEQITLPTLADTELRINLFSIPADSPPRGPSSMREPIGSAAITLGESVLELFGVNVEGSLDGNRALMVELESENFIALAGPESLNVLFIGANFAGQTAPSYIASPVQCGLEDPVDLADLGFPLTHLIIIAETVIEGSCRVDFDGDDELTAFDFMAFQNAFATGDPSTDFDGDGRLTVFDYLAFIDEYVIGCA